MKNDIVGQEALITEVNKIDKIMDLKTEIREYFYKIHGSHIETDITNIIAIAEKHIALQSLQTGVMRSFSYEEVQKIALDVINLGMSLRQDQLNGWTDKSGNEVLKEYMDRL